MAAEKMTKAMWFEELKGVVLASEYANKDEAIEFIDKQLETLAGRAAKAKERAEGYKKPGVRLKEEKKKNTINSRKNNRKNY